MIIWTLIFNIVTGNIVTPLVYGRMVHLHPAVVLVAIPGGAAVAGMLGMFIVVPAMAVVASTWRTVLSVIGTHRQVATPADEIIQPTTQAVLPGHRRRHRPSRPEGRPPDPTPRFSRIIWLGKGLLVDTRLTGDISCARPDSSSPCSSASSASSGSPQGTGIIAGSAMSGSWFWAIVGIVLLALAAVIAAREWRLSTSR